MKLRTMFALRRANEYLQKVRDLATVLATMGGRPSLLSGIGLVAHAAGFLASSVSKEYSEIVTHWHRIPLRLELHQEFRDALLPTLQHRENEWLCCRLGDQNVIACMDYGWTSGHFFAEKDPKAVVSWVREQMWKKYGPRTTISPSGTGLAFEPSQAFHALPSRRAQEVWGRIKSMVRIGEHRSVLLNGVPRTGKSTIARQVVLLAESELKREFRVLRIPLPEFGLFGSISTSTIETILLFLLPDVVLLDDVDRLGSGDSLLDLFEMMHRTVPLVLATSNRAKILTPALRLPGRVDEVLEVNDSGLELAEQVMSYQWFKLNCEQREILASWPVALIHELKLRMDYHQDLNLAEEMGELILRAQEACDFSRAPPTIPNQKAS